MGSKIDLEKICRICLITAGDLTDVRNVDAGNISIQQILHYIFEKECLLDSFPKLICSHCAYDVESTYTFKQKCEKSFNYISKCLQSKTDNVADPFLYAYKNIEEVEVEETNIKVESNVIKNELEGDTGDIDYIPTENKEYQSSVKVEDTLSEDEENPSMDDLCIATGESYCCVICENEFQSTDSLRMHMEIHTGENFNTNEESDERRPTTLHNYKKWHKCTICSKKFLIKANLDVHLREVHYRQRHKCEECGKSFAWKSSFYRHQTKHRSNSKQYMCKVCNKILDRLYNLKEHQKVHKQEGGHKCETCGKYFAWKSSYERHLAIHTDVKMYVCKICNKGFQYKQNLDRHLNESCSKKIAGVNEAEIYESENPS